MSAPKAAVVNVDGVKMLRQGDRLLSKTQLIALIEQVGEQVVVHAQNRAQLADDVELDGLSQAGQVVIKNMVDAIERRSMFASKQKAALEVFLPLVDDDPVEDEVAKEPTEAAPTQ